MKDRASQITDLLARMGPYFGVEDKNRLLAYRLLDASAESVLTHSDTASSFGNPELSPDRILESKSDPVLSIASTLLNITNGGRYVTDSLMPTASLKDGEVKLKPSGGMLSSLRDLASGADQTITSATDDIIDKLKEGKYFQLWTNKAIATDYSEYLGNSIGGYYKPGDENSNPSASLFAGVAGDAAGDIQNPPSKKNPGVTIFRMLAPELLIHNHDAGLTSMWAAGIPPLELSQCVPYLDVRFFSGQDASVTASGKLGGFPSASKHALGTKNLDDNEMRWADAQAIDGEPKEFLAENEVTVTGAQAGMELFTMPQTWTAAQDDFVDNSDDWPVHADGPLKGQYVRGAGGRINPILNKFRPLMTVTGFDVSVMSSNPVISTKSATMTIVMHDRSRLGEVAPFVRADRSSGMEVLVEWGWSHPHATTDYGKILNMTRRKEKFIITMTNYNFDTTGQVTITIKLMSKGQGRLRFGLISESDLQSKSLGKINEATSAISALVEDATVAGGDISKAAFGKSGKLAHFTSAEGVMAIRGDDLQELLDEAKKRIENRAVAGGNPNELYSLLHNCVANMTEYRNIIAETFTETLNKLNYEPVSGQDDPWLPVEMELTSGQTPSEKVSKYKGADLMERLEKFKFFTRGDSENNRGTYPDCVSFAKLITLFCLPAAIRSQKFDDIQVYFYPFNYNSGYMRHITIGDFPIPIDAFKTSFDEFIKSQANPSVLQFITFVIQTFMVDKTNPIYGFSTLFSKTKDGKNKRHKWVTEDIFVERIDLCLNLAYGVPAGHPKYIEPRVKVKMDVVPALGDEKGSILRMHFYDDCASGYSSFNDILQEAQDSSLGSLNTLCKHTDTLLNSSVHDEKGKVNQLTGASEAMHRRINKHLDLLVSTGLLTRIENDGDSNAFPPQPDASTLTEEEKPGVSEFTIQQMNEARFAVTASPRVLKYVISSRMPTLKYGSEYGIIQNASIGSEADQKFATLQLSRRMRTGSGSPLSDNSELGLVPFQVNPINLSLTTIGCPFFEHGQQFFFDFQTGTSIDNAYIVTGVEHQLTPGSFETTLKLVPTDKFGFMNTLTDTLAKLKTKVGLLQMEELQRSVTKDKIIPKYRKPVRKLTNAEQYEALGYDEWDAHIIEGKHQRENNGYGTTNIITGASMQKPNTTAYGYKKPSVSKADGSHFSDGTPMPEEYRLRMEKNAQARIDKKSGK